MAPSRFGTGPCAGRMLWPSISAGTRHAEQVEEGRREVDRLRELADTLRRRAAARGSWANSGMCTISS